MKEKQRRYRIVLEEPPSLAAKAKVKKAPQRSLLRQFIDRVDSEYPDKWVVAERSVKTASMFYYIRKHNYPHMEVVTRRNPDKTFGVWVRMVSAKKVSV